MHNETCKTTRYKRNPTINQWAPSAQKWNKKHAKGLANTIGDWAIPCMPCRDGFRPACAGGRNICGHCLSSKLCASNRANTCPIRTISASLYWHGHGAETPSTNSKQWSKMGKSTSTRNTREVIEVQPLPQMPWKCFEGVFFALENICGYCLSSKCCALKTGGPQEVLHANSLDQRRSIRSTPKVALSSEGMATKHPGIQTSARSNSLREF